MKTIFFVLATKTRINFILRTDLFKILKEKYRIVIVTPFWKDKDFVSEFGGQNVIFEPLYGPGRFSLMLGYWRGQALAVHHPAIEFGRFAHSFLTRRFRRPPSFTQKIKNFIRGLVLAIIPNFFKKTPVFWDAVENIFISRKCAVDLFKKYHPSVVILSTTGPEEKDNPFLLACKKFNVFSIAVDNNIDAPQMRYFSQPKDVSKYAVFGEPMKKEFMEIHKVPESKLVVTGALRYDYYFKEFKPMPKEEFFKEIGADPKKKLITFGAKTPLMYPHNADIIKVILENIKNNIFGQPSQLFVRFDPNHDPNLYPDILPYIIYERAENSSGREHIANLLYHSDVVISVASTFCIEACLVDTPAIWIGFDGFTRYPTLEESTRIHYNYDVFKRIISTGAILLAENFEELIISIKKYLSDKSLDREKRKKMIEQEYFKTDGRTGERIAKIVIDFVS